MKRQITCEDMVRAYLEQHGYDGLVAEDINCACTLDDLMPCGGDYAMSCVAGHKVMGCSPECGEGCDYHIVPGPRRNLSKPDMEDTP
ncbi:MAG: hypothetical protein KatS3mg051_2097 [Anaerolineae bacterium]|nr:MAG: hypothetical protein KatS3mg051_2097 [Anaerolineae bacterium]